MKNVLNSLDWPIGWLAITSLLVGLVGGSFAEDVVRQGPEHVVLVMADDQGWGQTSYNGHPRLKTPNLDAMAANGLRFDRFYAAGPVCSPTRASVLTGRTHQRAGVPSHGHALRHEETTLAQILKQQGFVTGHFGKWHLNGLRGPGVPILGDDAYGPGHFGFDRWLSVTNFFDRDPIMSRRGKFEEFAGDSSEIIVAEAIKFIETQANAGRPSLSVIWYGTPHNPFRATEEDMRPFEDLDENSKTQLGELVAMDRSVGTLRAALRRIGIEKQTLVWFTSDNGGLPKMTPETTGGLRGYKGSLYEGGLRVPTIIEWPGQVATRTTAFPAVSMDIVPTLGELLDIDPGVWLQPQDGMSLVPLFQGELERRKQPISFHYNGNHALVDNQFKLIQFPARRKQTARFELYDLLQDPDESDNLLESHPEVAQRLQEVLQRQVKSVQASIDAQDYPSQRVRSDYPTPRHWNETDLYLDYFEAWKDRPEYRSRLNKPAKRKLP